MIPYLFFPGTCREAVTRYAEIFGVPVPEFMTAAGMPEEERAKMPGVPDDAVMHVTLETPAGTVFASDDAGEGAPAMQGMNIHVTLHSGDAGRVYDALAEGGDARMPFAPVFWAPGGFGTVTDRWGTRWMIEAAAEG